MAGPSSLRNKLQEALAQREHLPRALRLAARAAPGWLAAWFAMLVLQGLIPAATVALTRPLVDGLVALAGVAPTWEAAQPVVLLAAVMAGLLLLGEVLKSYAEVVRTALAEHTQDLATALIHRQAIAADYAVYESPVYHDLLHRAREQAQGRVPEVLENGGTLLRNSLAVLGIAAVLLPYGWWLPLALAASALPALAVVLRHQWRYHRWWRGATEAQRRANYFDWMLTWDLAAAELRLFGWGPRFAEAYGGLRTRLRGERLALLHRQGTARFLAGLVSLGIAGGVMAWVGLRALQGAASLGDLALFWQAFSQGQALMSGLFASGGQLLVNLLFLGHLFQFLDHEPTVADPPEPVAAPQTLHEGIRFENVRFSYPGTERLALEDFSLELPAGRLTAVVGANGAGKSTLVKLLCRFYDPEAGRVTLDGTDLRAFALADLRRQLSVMFQFPVPYHDTVAENVAIGEPDRDVPRREIEEAVRGAGAEGFVQSLPEGYDTFLGKWFMEGTELSGGERQRLALARAFLRQAPVLVLDEPTSFMDAWAESLWLDRFRALAEGRTALVITHRFTTAMRADVIHVMEAGRVVESGTHRELLAAGGRYAASWSAQMEAAGQAAAGDQTAGVPR